MKSKMQFAMFWAGVLLSAFVAVNVWPARVALGPVGTLEDDDTDSLDVTRVVAYGCILQSPITVGGSTGWRVVVWADYITKEPGQAHDWEKWLSFREGKKGDEKAAKDCREWRRALQKRIEKITADKRK